MRLRNILILVTVLAVAAAVYFVTRPGEEPSSEPDPTVRLWKYEMEDLEHIVIELPRLDMSESFIKHADQQWYFDYPSGPRADPERWGGGIPFILSGPVMEKSVVEDATEERLADFGFAPPSMKITLTTEDEITNIEVGDATVDGSAYYIRLAESNNVYTIVREWYDVLEDIVLDPPYPPEEEE